MQHIRIQKNHIAGVGFLVVGADLHFCIAFQHEYDLFVFVGMWVVTFIACV